MKATQYDRLERLLTRKKGATAMDIATEVGSTSPHRRLADMREKGWVIVRRQIDGRCYGSYHGTPPRAA